MTEGDSVAVVNVSIHPTGNYVLATTSNGKVFFLLKRDDDGKMEILVVLQEADAKYSTAKLHPDGLILVAGRKDGKVSIWDLKTQTMASSLKVCVFHSL